MEEKQLRKKGFCRASGAQGGKVAVIAALALGVMGVAAGLFVLLVQQPGQVEEPAVHVAAPPAEVRPEVAQPPALPPSSAAQTEPAKPGPAAAPPELVPPAADAPTATVAYSPQDAAVQPGTKVVDGPWGRLIVRELHIEPPDRYAELISCFDLPVWVFRNTSKEQLTAFIRELGMDGGMEQRLLGYMVCDKNQGLCSISPDLETLLELPKHIRTRLYSWLGQFQDNPYIMLPLLRAKDDIDEWLKSPKISSSTSKLIEKVLWERPGFYLLSDFEAVCSSVPSAAEQRRLTRLLHSSPALLVSLQIDKNSDIDAMVKWWDRGQRNKALRSLMESLQQSKGGGEIDVVHFLPQLPRKLAFTYSEPGDESFNCHWTSLNFFNSVPDIRLRDPINSKKHIDKNYEDVTGTARMFGDMIVFLDDEGVPSHTAIYIAGDILFTKNGSTFKEPWKLMSLKEVSEIYRSATSEIRTLRLKTLE